MGKKVMLLSDLLARAGLPSPGTGLPVAVASVAADSRDVEPGALFVGLSRDPGRGADFLREAISRGAAAVAGEGEASATLGVPWIRVADAARALGDLLWQFHREELGRLRYYGVTGTDGKTSSCHYLRAVLAAAGRPAATIGTLGCFGPAGRQETGMTTPSAPELYRMLVSLAREGVTDAAVEMSSHGLDQRRAWPLPLELGIWTCLTHDHLDYHKEMEAYGRAKARLFEQIRPGGWLSLNRDDPWVRKFGAAAPGSRVWYGFEEGAEVRGRMVSVTTEGMALEISWDGRRETWPLPFVASYQAANALGVAAGLLRLGLDPRVIRRGLQAAGPVSGRMQRIPSPLPFAVFVDYAHTPGGLTAALSAARHLTPGKLSVVFGCGGNRDRTKRAPMGEIASRLADRVYVTSDNPRQEAPDEIIREVLSGVRELSRVRALPDRREAIAAAVAEAGEGDIILIAGKGHETCQIIGDHRLPFDDVQEARAALEEREKAGNPSVWARSRP